MTKRLLLTGASGFTGRHLSEAAASRGWDVNRLVSDLTDPGALNLELAGQAFDYVVHLAGISAVTHADEEAFYRVNLFGSLNLMAALVNSGHVPEKILVASSANVYGNSVMSPISETLAPAPVNHYAMSKLAMEHMLATYSGQLPIVIARPFNYTGVGHDDRFVIPKLIAHFTSRASDIELGNTQVEREFNDVRVVIGVYLNLLEKGKAGEVYNVCSGQPHSLNEVIELMIELTGHQIAVSNNPEFMRANELAKLYGDPAKLQNCLGEIPGIPLRETLQWMLSASE
jgi:nucleoside-diphosphate-sugar epimerase